MVFKISPKEEFHITERMTYQKDNKEINCGFLWKTGNFVTSHPPDFLASYEKSIGLSLGNQDFSEVNLSSEGRTLIYFSETIPKEEQLILKAIFESSTTTDDFDIGYQHKGWQLVDMDVVMWGELSVTEAQ